jgi:hypothetical protein
LKRERDSFFGDANEVSNPQSEKANSVGQSTAKNNYPQRNRKGYSPQRSFQKREYRSFSAGSSWTTNKRMPELLSPETPTQSQASRNDANNNILKFCTAMREVGDEEANLRLLHLGMQLQKAREVLEIHEFQAIETEQDVSDWPKQATWLLWSSPHASGLGWTPL